MDHENYPPFTTDLKGGQIFSSATYNQTGDNNNYLYDASGNLIKDVKEGIDNIIWHVTGKISQITKTDGSVMKYSYDSGGNRVSKSVTQNGNEIVTYYVRDASGNIMSTYERNYQVTSNSFVYKQMEVPIYGDKRLGLWDPKSQVKSVSAPGEVPCFCTSANFVTYDLQQMNLLKDWGAKFDRSVNKKRYEFTNHLGNVLAVVSDIKFDNGNGTYESDIVSVTDYYPFGMEMPGRSFNAGEYRFGFNGMEKDDEIKGSGNSYTTEFRQYAPRIARWLSLDPLMAKYPHQSPYVAFNNNPIYFADPTGLEGDPPVRDNALKAPEASVNNLKNVSQIIEDRAEEAFAKDKDDLTYGFIKSGTGFEKVFFDPEFQDGDIKGAYFSQKASMEQSGITTKFPIDISLDKNNNIDEMTLNSVDKFMDNADKLLNFYKGPAKDDNQVLSVTVFSAEKAYKANSLQEKKSAQQIVESIKKRYPNANVFYSAKTSVAQFGESGSSEAVGFMISSANSVQITLTIKSNIYGF